MRHNIVHFPGNTGAFVLSRQPPLLLLLKFQAHGALTDFVLQQHTHTP